MNSIVMTLATTMEDTEDLKLHPENMGIHLHINEAASSQRNPSTTVHVEQDGGFFDFLREIHDEEEEIIQTTQQRSLSGSKPSPEMHDEEEEIIQTTQQRSLSGSKPSPNPTIHPTGPSRTPTAAPTYTPTRR